jgi:cysteine-rich repeat protein
MKFHQGLAGLLTLLMPVATVCYHTVTEWGIDRTPHQPVSELKAAAMQSRESEDTHPDRALDEYNSTDAPPPPRFTEADFCGGKPISRTVQCGGVDIIELVLVLGNYTIDVQRVNCELLDPESILFPPNEPTIPGGPKLFVVEVQSDFDVADSDDAGLGNLPAFCDRPSDDIESSDPLIKYDVKEGGVYSLLTQSLTFGSLQSCPTPINDRVLEYRVFISCTDCGDGILDRVEECEDGNDNNTDGCSASCRQPFCGDGVVDDGESCDDGNTISGDGCSATCQSEAAASSVQGDPHFMTWRGHHYDFHGECDLVFLHSSAFKSGLGLDVHIRTHIRRDMSYITSAAIRIGIDILEVESQGVYYLNGEFGVALPDQFSGFAFSHTQPTDKQHVFEVHLGGRERIKIKTYNDFVSLLIEQGQIEHFGDSIGLMGDFGKGRMLARDGKTILDNANEFGQEWQVLDTEPSLFQTPFLPQDKQECRLPPPIQASQLRRRLSSVDELAAEKACEHWGEGKADCVFDVLTTGDLEMAMVGSY